MMLSRAQGRESTSLSRDTVCIAPNDLTYCSTHQPHLQILLFQTLSDITKLTTSKLNTPNVKLVIINCQFSFAVLLACQQALFRGNVRMAKPRVSASGRATKNHQNSQPFARCRKTRGPQREPARRLLLQTGRLYQQQLCLHPAWTLLKWLFQITCTSL